MFTLTTPSGQTTGDICDVLAAAEAGRLVGLPAAPHYARHGVVANLGALMAVLWAYSERPRPWGADEWRSEWDAQLGPGNREFIRPMDEPALFQRPVSPGAKIEPIEPAEIGPSPLGDLHIRKAKKVPDEAVVLGHIASTLRPTTGVGRGGAGTRAGFLMVIPTDGTIGSEIKAVAEATTVSGGTSAKNHIVWLSPSLQKAVPTSASPLIDAPMASRLTPDGVLHGRSERPVDVDGELDPQVPLRVGKSDVRPMKCSNASPFRWQVCLGALADGVSISKAAVSRAAPIVAHLHGLPGLRLVTLMAENGKTTGFRELILPARPATARVFALAGQGSTDRPSQLARRLVAAVSEAKSHLSGALLKLCRNSDDEAERDVAFASAGLFEADAGFAAVKLFAERLGEEDDDTPHITAMLLRRAWEHFERAASACPDPLRVARGELRLREMEKTTMAPHEIPLLGRQIWAILKEMRSELSPNDRAAIRGSGQDETPPMAVWRCMSRVPPDQIANPDAERIWRMAISYLGSADIGGRRAGRALYGSEYPEPRMQSLLANRGAGHVSEALAWLRSTDTANVDITPLVALALSDIMGDAETRRWAERTLAIDYVRPPARASETQAPEPAAAE